MTSRYCEKMHRNSGLRFIFLYVCTAKQNCGTDIELITLSGYGTLTLALRCQWARDQKYIFPRGPSAKTTWTNDIWEQAHTPSGFGAALLVRFDDQPLKITLDLGGIGFTQHIPVIRKFHWDRHRGSHTVNVDVSHGDEALKIDKESIEKYITLECQEVCVPRQQGDKRWCRSQKGKILQFRDEEFAFEAETTRYNEA